MRLQPENDHYVTSIGGSQSEEAERRRQPRSRGISGVVVVLGRGHTGEFSIGNLSAAGARLIGEVEIAQGEEVELLFRIDGERAFAVPATVTRSEPLPGSRHLLAAAFQAVPTDIDARLRQLVVSCLDTQWIMSRPTLLIIAGTVTGASAERDLRDAEWTVIAVTTSLDMIRRLHDRNMRFEAALLDLEHRDGSNMLEYLAEQHPGIRRIVTAPRAMALAPAISSRAHVLVTSPWEKRSLIDALGSEETTDRIEAPWLENAGPSR